MRILLLTRHYPPAVSGGAKRPFLLSEALRKMGCEIFVVAPSLPEGEPGVSLPHPNRDPSIAPPGPQSLRGALREWLLWPDPDIRWVNRAAQKAADAAPWRPDWIWTTSPPESIHAAGAQLKRKFGAKWLADFRDHWLDRPHRQERAAAHRRIGEKLIARRWLAKADLITCVDKFIANELSDLGADNPVVAPHFMPEAQPVPVELPAEEINVVHTGSIELSDPEARIADLLSPFEKALSRNAALRLHLVGRLTEAELAHVKASPARARIDIHGVKPLETALGFQQAADALILVGSTKTRVPPSKITEYMASAAPIIACGKGDWRGDKRLQDHEPEDALARLARGQRRTDAVRPPRATDIAEQILSLMQEKTQR